MRNLEIDYWKSDENSLTKLYVKCTQESRQSDKFTTT